MVDIRKGMEFKMYVPNEYGKVVSMIEHSGLVYVACEFAIFYLEPSDNTLYPIKFISNEETNHE
jgi:hypothetical protein